MLKPEIRILGFDDGPFKPRSNSQVPVVGVVYRGGNFIDGIVKTEITVDGTDATDKIEKLINSSRHKQQLKVIMFDGITLGGFNIIDVKKLHISTNLPVVIINRKHPNLDKVKNALKNFDDFEVRWKLIESAGKIKECDLNNGVIVFYQSEGLSDEDTKDVIRLSTTHSQIPEPLRVAHLIATGIVKGESFGRA